MTIHSEKKIINHKPEDLFDLVADVRRYPEFLPWCLASRIRSETEKEIIAELIIGFQIFKEQSNSTITASFYMISISEKKNNLHIADVMGMKYLQKHVLMIFFDSNFSVFHGIRIQNKFSKRN